ncbi:MAG TPA: hypothetical protein VJY33_17075, partial [Isosphaeraceae bacterium]|nr:hypothetical protein [Isosphaeraceae bacterium]
FPPVEVATIIQLSKTALGINRETSGCNHHTVEFRSTGECVQAIVSPELPLPCISYTLLVGREKNFGR